MEDYFKINEKLWDVRTALHAKSKFYDVDGFKKTRNSLSAIEDAALSNIIGGKKLLHLQCHFGLDTLSFSHKGALATGVDISGEAILLARKLADDLGYDAKFVKCNILDLNQHLDEKYDIVFTSYGAICWLPNLEEWANLIYQYLVEGGIFYMVEFHPFFSSLDHGEGDIKFHYFNKKPYEEMMEFSYTDGGSHARMKEICWNHSIQNVIMALLTAGLKLQSFHEYDFSPYNCFDNLTERTTDEYVYNKVDVAIPHVFSLQAYKE